MSEAERRARAERLAALRATGADPYPASIGAVMPLARVRERWDALDAAALEATPVRVAVAGRVMAIRSFGKLVFFTLREDGSWSVNHPAGKAPSLGDVQNRIVFALEQAQKKQLQLVKALRASVGCVPGTGLSKVEAP